MDIEPAVFQRAKLAGPGSIQGVVDQFLGHELGNLLLRDSRLLADGLEAPKKGPVFPLEVAQREIPTFSARFLAG